MVRKLALALALALLFAGVAWALSPLEEMKKTTDQVLDILKDKSLSKPDMRAERHQRLWKVVSARFDFKEMARRSLARHWAKRTPEERQEFVDLFAFLLHNSYVDKFDTYTGEQVIFEREKVEDDYASVRVKVVTQSNMDIPIEYRLIKEDDDWYIYDVVIEGVSLVSNYRAQFNKIIVSSSYDELVRRMKDKQVEQEVLLAPGATI